MVQARLETIRRGEVLRYLGWRGDALPEEQERLVEECIATVGRTARPRVVYRMFALSGAQLSGVPLRLEGQDIRRHLQGCSQAVLMAATLGAEAETLLLRAQVSDLARALVLDSAASAAIENVCDNLEADLRREAEQRGQFLTDRFSPGYGDLPIALQGPLCEVLDARRRIGLTVSGSGILIPRKSVTAILGLADTPRPRRSYGCASCSLSGHCDKSRCRKVSNSPL